MIIDDDKISIAETMLCVLTGAAYNMNAESTGRHLISTQHPALPSTSQTNPLGRHIRGADIRGALTARGARDAISRVVYQQIVFEE